MTWLSRMIAERRAKKMVREMFREQDAKLEKVSATIGVAATESVRRFAFLEEMAANGTPEERQWVTATQNGPLATTEEDERIRNAPSPTERIARYRAACAAYDVAHAGDVKAAFDAAFPKA